MKERNAMLMNQKGLKVELNDRLNKFENISKKVENSARNTEMAVAYSNLANAEARIIAALIEKTHMV